jgi:hypothetical protein
MERGMLMSSGRPRPVDHDRKGEDRDRLGTAGGFVPLFKLRGTAESAFRPTSLGQRAIVEQVTVWGRCAAAVRDTVAVPGRDVNIFSIGDDALPWCQAANLSPRAPGFRASRSSACASEQRI